MNEEIEYAEMLEIPVSTVNVVKKKRRRKKAEDPAPVEKAIAIELPLKDTVIEKVNNRLEFEPSQITADADLFAESANSEGRLEFAPTDERIDTVRLYPRDGLPHAEEEVFEANEGGRVPLNKESKLTRAFRITMSAEFALACALCGAIFLTNVFLPNSAINTFFRALHDNAAEVTDDRGYAEFTLSPIVSELSGAELTLSPAGVLSFQEECCVYPAANGTVREITHSNGIYTVKVSYSDTFTGVLHGLSHVYYAEGDAVKANVPLGFTNGENEVQVTMYSAGELLNCFELTDENCLAWLEEPNG